MSKSAVIEIEIAGSNNAALFFYPTDSRLRGRFDARSMPAGRATALLAQNWPDAIPGQVAGIDTAKGEAWVRDRLYEPEFAALKRKIESKGFTLPPERIEFSGPHLPTWQFWMARAVESKSAVLLAGALPMAASLQAEAKTARFAPQQSQTEQALQQLAAQNAQLVAAIRELVQQVAARG